MENEIDKLKKIIVNTVNIYNLKVDVFISGSFGRHEVRYNKKIIVSDVDIIVIYEDMSYKEMIIKCFENIKKNTNKKIDIGFVYCKVDNFIGSYLADYVLSIDLDEPVVKKLNYIYQNASDLKLNKIRWLYQCQPMVYYFCRYVIDSKDDSLAKAYLNLIKVMIYKKNLVDTNRYLYNKDLSLYLGLLSLDDKLYNNSLCCLDDGIQMKKNIKNEIYSSVKKGISELFVDVKENNENCLKSVRYFFVIENSENELMKDTAYQCMKYVVEENTGENNFSCIHI